MNSEGLCEIFGIVCLLLFVFANVYYPARLIAYQYRPWPKDIVMFFKKYRELHMSINIVAFVVMSLHVYFSDERNIFLYASLLVTAWLTFAGILMRSKLFTGDTKRQMRLIHTQQTIFLVWLALLIVGHAVE